MYTDGPWEHGFLTRDLHHFQGTEYPAGTEVDFRAYPADPDYTEVRLPDGLLVTETNDVVEVHD